ncbi:MAG: iron-containing alcohol dehydrogenase [Lachnospiraceae bacterium]|nr:iron-containing alcohol dehydrogenase [Lachnospiraceae bacterium]
MSWLIHDLHDCLFGVEAYKEIGTRLKGYGATKIWYIYDAALKDMADKVTPIMEEAGLEVMMYAAEPGEPDNEMCQRAVDSCKAFGADGIVGIGGGATMDTAKMVGKTIANGGKVMDYLGGYTALNVGTKVFSPIVLIPTTAGTGSEVSYGLAIHNNDTGLKTFVVHPATLALIDPVLTVGMPKPVTAATGADALAHSMESLCNADAMPNWMGDMICKEGIRQYNMWMMKAYDEPDNLDARAGMSYSAMLGGYAITLRKTTFGHALANQISNNYPYGHGVAIGPGNSVVTRYIAKADHASVKRIAPCFDIPCPEGADLQAVGQKIVERVDEIQKHCQMKNMKELGLPESFCDMAADEISKDTKWKIVPNPPDFELLRQIIHEAYDC